MELSSHSEDVSASNESALMQLNELSARSPQRLRHKPLGFSVSSFRYTVRSATVADCADQISIGVDLILNGRRIEVAREVMANKCLGPVAVVHYRRHADADYEAFSRLTARVGNTLQLPVFQEVMKNIVDFTEAEKIVASVVNSELTFPR